MLDIGDCWIAAWGCIIEELRKELLLLPVPDLTGVEVPGALKLLSLVVERTFFTLDLLASSS